MRWYVGIVGIGLMLQAPAARADFILSNAIVEFTSGGDTQRDIELISRSAENDYVETAPYLVENPGSADEKRTAVDDPSAAGLLVTPDKTILAAGGRRVVRFVLLRAADDKEHIYRVTSKPVIGAVNNSAKMGLKLLVGYEVLVIVRPAVIHPQLDIMRQGAQLQVTNRGNSNMLLQPGLQCPAGEANKTECKATPAARVYPGQTATVALPFAQGVTYSIWDGQATVTRDIP